MQQKGIKGASVFSAHQPLIGVCGGCHALGVSGGCQQPAVLLVQHQPFSSGFQYSEAGECSEYGAT